MEEIKLTREAKKSIAVIYKAYNNRRYSGQNKEVAASFDRCIKEQNEIIDSVRRDIPELKKAGLVRTDILGNLRLSDPGIIYMENKTADTIKEWLSFVTQLIP